MFPPVDVPDVVLATPRCRMRPFVPEDGPRVEVMLGDPLARRFFGLLWEEPDLGARWVARNRDRYAREGVGLWALEDHAGVFLGDCGLIWQEVEGERILEVGYHLTAAARGQGYATEAALACRDLAIVRGLAPRVHSIVAVDNEASHRVARRIHDHVRRGGTFKDIAVDLYWSEAPALA